MSPTAGRPDFPHDPNGPASTFASAILQLIGAGDLELAETLAGANHVAMSPVGGRPDREYVLQLHLHPAELRIANERQDQIAGSLATVSAFGWNLQLLPADAELTRLRDELNAALDEQGLPIVLDVRYRDRPGGGSHNVAVHDARADPVHVAATDDILFRLGRRQTAWTRRQPAQAFAASAPTGDLAPEQNRRLVFVSYSTADEGYRDELMRHLAPIQRDLADVWTFRQIKAGENHHDEIAASLKRSEIGILLISADFLASNYVADIELPVLTNGDKKLFAVVVGQCDHTHLTSDLYAPWGLSPLNKMTPADREEIYTDVAKALREALTN